MNLNGGWQRLYHAEVNAWQIENQKKIQTNNTVPHSWGGNTPGSELTQATLPSLGLHQTGTDRIPEL